jgi:hypothetical protein
MRKNLTKLGRAALGLPGLLAIFGANADDGAPPGAAQGAATAAMLVYQVEESGLAPYVERTLITDLYVRLDQGGAGDQGFVLFDRGQATIYSVSPEDRTILVLTASGPPLRAPADLELIERNFEPEATTGVGGRRPLGLELLANGELCRRVVVLPGAMEEALAGLREYAAVLAYQQVGTLEAIPPEMQSSCDLAGYVYAPARELRHGLPMESWEPGGKHQLLLDVDPKADVPADLFSLPAGYRRFTLDEMREGAMSP